MYVNGEKTYPLIQDHEGGRGSNSYLVNFQWSKKLQIGDRVKLRAYNNVLYTQINYQTYFHGYLVKADE